MAAHARFPRLHLPVLCLVLVCLSLPAWAGHWTVGYSVTPNGGGGFPIGPNFTGSYSQSLTVTATLTWANYYPGEVPPTTVSYVETGSANCGGGTSNPPKYGLVNPKPVCDDGLNDPSVPANTNSATQCYATSQGAHLVQKPYSSPLVLPARTLSVKFTCDSAHSDNGSGSGGMGYSVAISTASLGGHSTVDTSAVNNPWDPANPRFFSGTNCGAYASMPAISGNVSHAQLLVGGTAVKDYYDTTFPNHPAAGPNVTLGTSQALVQLGCNFDSTHFGDGNPILIKMTVIDTMGGNYDASITGKAYNKLYDLGNSTMVHGSSSMGDILGVFSSSNVYAVPTSSDDKTAMETNIPIYTDLHTYTHGEPGELGDCLATSGAMDPAHNLSSSDVSTARNNKTVNQPPYNFVLLCACQCNADATLAGGFGIADGSVDRACLGFSTNADNSSTTQSWAKAIWQDLAGGQTLSKAMVDANATYKPMNQGSAATVKTYGDNNTTVCGTVYAGTTVSQLSK